MLLASVGAMATPLVEQVPMQVQPAGSSVSAGASS
jgi:hypothetical protein